MQTYFKLVRSAPLLIMTNRLTGDNKDQKVTISTVDGGAFVFVNGRYTDNITLELESEEYVLIETLDEHAHMALSCSTESLIPAAAVIVLEHCEGYKHLAACAESASRLAMSSSNVRCGIVGAHSFAVITSLLSKLYGIVFRAVDLDYLANGGVVTIGNITKFATTTELALCAWSQEEVKGPCPFPTIVHFPQGMSVQQAQCASDDLDVMLVCGDERLIGTIIKKQYQQIVKIAVPPLIGFMYGRPRLARIVVDVYLPVWCVSSVPAAPRSCLPVGYQRLVPKNLKRMHKVTYMRLFTHDELYAELRFTKQDAEAFVEHDADVARRVYEAHSEHIEGILKYDAYENCFLRLRSFLDAVVDDEDGDRVLVLLK